jgi:hypothetical protein
MLTVGRLVVFIDILGIFGLTALFRFAGAIQFSLTPFGIVPMPA